MVSVSDIFCMHSSVDGYSGCFHNFAFVNNAALNIGVHVSFQIRVFFGYMPMSGIAGSYGNSGTYGREQIAYICWIIEKAREFQKNIYFCFIDYAKAFDCVDHNKLWKVLQEMGIPDHLTCRLKVRKQQLDLDMEQQTGSK